MIAETTTMPIEAGEIVIGGERHMRDAKGRLVPASTIKAADQLEDETVRKIIGYARDLSAQIGRFAERFGGTRLYVASAEGASIARELGDETAAQLARHYAGSYIRVPLARERRARQYRARSMSNAEIARRLGITETGVDKMFSRMANKPAKGGDARQPDLFQTS